jgi:translocation and assembly module TamA
MCHAPVARAHTAIFGFHALAQVSILRWRHSMRTRQALVLAVATVVSACAHGNNGPRATEDRLEKVSFEGNQQLKDKTLLTGLGAKRVMQRGGAVDPYMVQVDADRIRGEYLRKGYLDVDVRSRVERKGETATVIYTVEEGVRAKTEAIITGLPDDIDQAAVRKKLPLAEGQAFDYEVYDLAKPDLLQVVQDAGYAHATLDASVIADRASHTAAVLLVYTPGPKTTFGQTQITGATGELATAIEERLAFTPGQTYSAQALLQTQRNLYGLGRFSTVRVDTDKSEGYVVGVKVAVSESARREIRLGGGVGIDQVNYEVRGRAGYTIAGWPFPLDTVTLDFRPAYALPRQGGSPEPRIKALARLERQDLFLTYAKGVVEAGYNYLTVEAFTSYGPEARVGYEARLGTPRLVGRVGWGFERADFRNEFRALIKKATDMDEVDAVHSATADLRHYLNLDRMEQIGAFQQSLIVDLRDHPIEPTLGGYAELRVTEGTRFAGGNYEFLRFEPDVRGYLPLPLIKGAVLAGHLRYGAIYANAANVPPTERLFSGGSNSQRGFGERRLSPSTPPDLVPDHSQTIPYGGTRLIDTSLEARIPVTTIRKMPLGFALFLDGGDVVDPNAAGMIDTRADGMANGQAAAQSLDLGNLHWALGAGLRLLTIVGPVRIDVAYRITRTGAGEPDPGSSFAYHLTVGEAF